VDLVERANGRWLEESTGTKLIEKIGPGVFFQRVVKPALLQQECDEEVVRQPLKNNCCHCLIAWKEELKGLSFYTIRQ